MLFASAGGFNVDPSAYDKKDFTAYIIPNLNWLLSKFLGPLFSPTGFLNDPDICKDGYVSTDYLEEAFEEFDLERQELLHILDYYKVSSLFVEWFCDSLITTVMLYPCQIFI